MDQRSPAPGLSPPAGSGTTLSMGVPSQPAFQRQPCLRPLRLDHREGTPLSLALPARSTGFKIDREDRRVRRRRRAARTAGRTKPARGGSDTFGTLPDRELVLPRTAGDDHNSMRSSRTGSGMVHKAPAGSALVQEPGAVDGHQRCHRPTELTRSSTTACSDRSAAADQSQPARAMPGTDCDRPQRRGPQHNGHASSRNSRRDHCVSKNRGPKDLAFLDDLVSALPGNLEERRPQAEPGVDHDDDADGHDADQRPSLSRRLFLY